MSAGSMRSSMVLAVLAACLASVACADEHGTSQRAIAVSGHGEASGRPDQASVNAGVQTMAATVVEASRENQAAIERIMQALEAEGIDEEDIQTSNYSIWPEQRHDPERTPEVRIVGYHVSNVVNVTVKDIDRVGRVLAAVTNAGANSIHGINFGVADTAELEERARAAAMADARRRAESLAELAGVELGDVLTISMVQGGGQPVPMMGGGRMAMAEAAPAPGISPGQLSVSVQVQVSWAIR